MKVKELKEFLETCDENLCVTVQTAEGMEDAVECKEDRYRYSNGTGWKGRVVIMGSSV